MDGLLLRLLNDTRGTPGAWFWPCFKPLCSTLDGYFWIFINQPWMGAPLAFDHERECADYPGAGQTSVGLWRPGAVGRWADRFAEEYIELWAVDRADDPARVASAFCRTPESGMEAFIEDHAQIWLIYTDSTCWEIFAREPSLLEAVRDHLFGETSVGVYKTTSANRGRAYAKAGVGAVWRAMHGQ